MFKILLFLYQTLEKEGRVANEKLSKSTDSLQKVTNIIKKTNFDKKYLKCIRYSQKNYIYFTDEKRVGGFRKGTEKVLPSLQRPQKIQKVEKFFCTYNKYL